MHTDIQDQSIVFKKTPPAWHPYIKLTRLDRPAGTWLLLLPCWWALALAQGNIHYAALFGLGALLMRSAGCIVNDLWDRHLDAAVARTQSRPLASGDISVRQAVIALGILCLAAFIILLQFNRLTICLGILSLALVATYPLMKRITWWPQFFLGLTFNWGALMGWAAVNGHLGYPAFLVYIGGIFWTLAYDTIYAHQDKEDDALIGIKSTALLFGDKSKICVAIFFVFALVLFAWAKYAANHVLPILVILPALHAIGQIRNWHMDDPQSCLDTFNANQIFGWLLLFAFAL